MREFDDPFLVQGHFSAVRGNRHCQCEQRRVGDGFGPAGEDSPVPAEFNDSVSTLGDR
jgi:hypothetical protein